MPGRRVHPTIVAVVVGSQLLWTSVAGASGPEPTEPAGAEAATAPEPTDPEPDAPISPAEHEAPVATNEAASAPGPVVTEVESPPPPQGGGIAGSVISADDPQATQAQTDLEGEALDRNAAGVPARMPPLRVAGWWTMFGTVALGTVAGIFSGLAERQEDEAERLALGFDLETGKRFEYEQHAAEYEAILDKGNTYQWVSRGFLIGAGVALATSITLFAVQAKRDRREGASKKVALRGLGLTSVEVAF